MQNMGHRHHFKHHRFHGHHHGSSSLTRFFIALLVAIGTYFLATKFIANSIFLWIEAGAWIYFSFLLYKRAFRWANRVSMADDLAFWGLRILGGAVFVIGIYIAFFVGVASLLTTNSAPISIPIYILLAGLILLGLFIAFRTNRRYSVVGIWRA